MKSFLFALALSVLALSPAKAQPNAKISEMPYAGAPCTGEGGGVKASPQQTALFKNFDAALRSALKWNDTTALAFLINFPLRVNTARGSILLPDAQALDGYYTEFFPAKLRDVVLTTVPGDYICRYDEGLGYKAGAIWVSTDGHKFGVDAINAEVADDQHTKQAKPALSFACETTTYRISIEDLNDGKYRYRSWHKPKELSGAPDPEISDGTLRFEGTGICSVPVYSFTKGNTVYTISGGLGCTDGSEPKKATGDLLVTTTDGKKISHAWCF